MGVYGAGVGLLSACWEAVERSATLEDGRRDCIEGVLRTMADVLCGISEDSSGLSLNR